MKAEEIMELFQQFEAIANEYEGVECWSARELSNLLGYVQWRNFENIIGKAKVACTKAGQEVNYHGDYIRHYPKFCHGKPFLFLKWLRGRV